MRIIGKNRTTVIPGERRALRAPRGKETQVEHTHSIPTNIVMARFMRAIHFLSSRKSWITRIRG
jgi:hypothetical protein